jgi:hypothetical protein
VYFTSLLCVASPVQLHQFENPTIWWCHCAVFTSPPLTFIHSSVPFSYVKSMYVSCFMWEFPYRT